MERGWSPDADLQTAINARILARMSRTFEPSRPGSLRKAVALALTCLIVIWVHTVSAQEESGLYLNLDGGVSFLNANDARFTLGNTKEELELEFDPGYHAGLSIGYFFKEGASLSYKYWGARIDLAVELQTGLGYSEAKGDSLFPPGEASLDLYQVPAMVNLLFRIPVAERFGVWVGGGGGGMVEMASVDYRGVFGASDTTFVPGYQTFVRLHYDLTERLKLGAFYKLFGTQPARFGGDVDTRLESGWGHTIGLSAAFRF